LNLSTDYFSLPLSDDIIFDTELVSHKMQNLKRGKAADIFGLSAEHLLFSHPIVSVIIIFIHHIMVAATQQKSNKKRKSRKDTVILSKLFQLI